MPPRKRAVEGRHRAEETPREGQSIPAVPITTDTADKTKRRRPQHYDATPKAPAAPRKAPARKASASAPKSSPPAPRSSDSSPKVPGRGRGPGRSPGVLADEARDYALRQAYRATGGKPSTVGRAAAGGAAGAASGAAVGSVVPGVGTAVGAGTGALIGGTGGAIAGRGAKKAYKQAMRTNGAARRVIVAEFAVCVVICALSPLTDKNRDEPAGKWMKRMTAIMGVFFILGLVSAAGRGASRAAAGFGGIVVLGLAVSERDLFTKLAGIFGTDSGKRGVGEIGGDGVGGAESPGSVVPIGGIQVGGAEGPGDFIPIVGGGGSVPPVGNPFA